MDLPEIIKVVMLVIQLILTWECLISKGKSNRVTICCVIGLKCWSSLAFLKD